MIQNLISTSIYIQYVLFIHIRPVMLYHRWDNRTSFCWYFVESWKLKSWW